MKATVLTKADFAYVTSSRTDEIQSWEFTDCSITNYRARFVYCQSILFIIHHRNTGLGITLFRAYT